MARSRSARHTVLADPVYEALKERIMDREVVPGTRLNIDGLASELNVSPTPVREALTRLAAERLITSVPFKGYSVMPLLTPRRLADLIHVRRVLEVDAVRSAASRLILADIRAMERELDAMAELRPQPRFRDFSAYMRHDQAFHESLVSASGNRALFEAYRSLNIHVQLSRLFSERGEFDSGQSMIEHRAVLSALKRRNAEEAADALCAHIDGVETRLGTFLDERITQVAAP